VNTLSTNLMIKKIVLTGLAQFVIIGSMLAQADTDFLRSTGKIYTVVAVLGLIFIGIVFFLIYLERKVSKIEKEIGNE